MSKFCIMCGERLEDEALFCKACGNEQPKREKENNQQMEKIEDIEKMMENYDYDPKNVDVNTRVKELWIKPEYRGKIVKIIKVIREEYNLELKEAKEIVDKVIEEISGLEKLDEKTYEASVLKEHTKKSIELVINKKEKNELLDDYKKIRKGILELMIAQESLDKILEDLKEKQKKEKKIRDKFGIIGNIAMALGVLMFVGGIGGIIIGIIVMLIGGMLDKAISKDKFEKQADEYHNSYVVPVINTVKEAMEQIDKIWEKEEMVLYDRTVPEEYKQLDTINYFIRALETGRADNQKELFNLYEEELHRRKVETMQSEILDTQKKQLQASRDQLEKLNNIQKGQKHISRQVKYGNTVSTLDFLLKK